jgi:hypothetical protein
MSIYDNLPVVREGVWLYDGTVPVRVRILFSTHTEGTGNEDDEESISENQPIPCYFIAYEMAGRPGVLSNIILNLESLEAAIAYVENKFSGITWQEF